MAIYTARIILSDGTPSGGRMFRTDASFARYRVKTASALGYWDRVPRSQLAEQYKNDQVFIWRQYGQK